MSKPLALLALAIIGITSAGLVLAHSPNESTEHDHPHHVGPNFASGMADNHAAHWAQMQQMHGYMQQMHAQMGQTGPAGQINDMPCFDDDDEVKPETK